MSEEPIQTRKRTSALEAEIAALKAESAEVKTAVKALLKATKERENDDEEEYMPAGEYLGVKFE